MRINRHPIHRSIYEDYVGKFTERAAFLVGCDPCHPSSVIGPFIKNKKLFCDGTHITIAFQPKIEKA
jgi:acyl-CoA reductase-like NAD-dependent aldehyde dehydrogenase